MKQHCETCPTKDDCKKAFGAYWEDKSSGGVGCDHPFAYQKFGLEEIKVEEERWQETTFTL